MARPPVIRATVKSNNILKINAAFPGAIDLLLRKAATDTLAAAIMRVPVDTGALKNSLQVFHETSGARITAGVRAGMSYAGYVEYGTRHMAPQPYLTPPFEMVMANLLRNLVTLERAAGALI